MKILYAGDSPVGGPANYLLAVLKNLKAGFRHVPPGKTLRLGYFKKRFDVIILSDFSRNHAPAAVQHAVVRQIEEGCGFLMIGGWGSFSGPCGGWHGSILEKRMPVTCLNRDDRVNFPGGAHMMLQCEHPIFQGLSFTHPPAILGLNEIKPKKNTLTLLSAKKIIRVGDRVMLDPVEHPLLVIDAHPEKRIAALATDIAPHWCGGLLDWGKTHVTLPVAGSIRVEVGNFYVQFLSSLIRWLARA